MILFFRYFFTLVGDGYEGKILILKKMFRPVSKIIYSIAYFVFPLSGLFSQEILISSFPGAEGYGKYTTGGRGGQVCYVTTTEDVIDGAMCSFSYSTDGKVFIDAGDVFKATTGMWIGAKIGFFALRDGFINDAGSVDIDWFRIKKN
jgi:Beta xylosidase C-terminal Concanavalin A-like domain